MTRVRAASAGARSIVNVGAGSGSYEPQHAGVVAVEPSRVMISQRLPGAAPAIRGVAEALPFRNEAFELATAILTVHHWSDAEVGLAELRRVSRRQLVITWDPSAFFRGFWLVRDYVPEVAEWENDLATLPTVLLHLRVTSVEPLPVPADCTDGFCGAYWKRPRAYLDPAVRGAISSLAQLDPTVLHDAMQRLSADLDSGHWHTQNAALLDRDECDLGYRLVLAAG